MGFRLGIQNVVKVDANVIFFGDDYAPDTAERPLVLAPRFVGGFVVAPRIRVSRGRRVAGAAPEGDKRYLLFIAKNPTLALLKFGRHVLRPVLETYGLKRFTHKTLQKEGRRVALSLPVSRNLVSSSLYQLAFSIASVPSLSLRMSRSFTSSSRASSGSS